MPITFGSVGDIISISLIIKDLVDALDKSRGASAEYRGVISELWTLDRALLEVELLSKVYSGTPELNALCVATGRSVDRCRSLIEAFSSRIKKYDDHMAEGSSGSKIKGIGMKVRWQVIEKDEVEKFRAELAAHSTAISMLLGTATV